MSERNRINCGSGSRRLAQNGTVRVLASQVMDSRRARDCMEDLPVYFSDARSKEIVEACSSVKGVAATVAGVTFDVEPVTLKEGCFNVDCSYTFNVTLNAYSEPGAEPVQITGQCFYSNRCMLYGGCSGVQTFGSDGRALDASPAATAQVCEPVMLQAFVTRQMSSDTQTAQGEPESKAECIPGERAVFVTIGVFSVVSLERVAQVTVPAIRSGAMGGECAGGSVDQDPCVLFRRTAFPTARFRP